MPSRKASSSSSNENASARHTYLTRDAARLDVFAYIEMFYNPTRKLTNNACFHPVDFEVRQQKLNEAGV